MPKSIAGSERGQEPEARAGVTLLELIVVVVILGLMAAFVGPTIGRWIDDWRLQGAAERVAQVIRYARMRALYEHRYCLVELRPREHQVWVLEPASGFAREYQLPSAVGWSEDKKVFSASTLRLVLPPSGPVEERTLWLRNSVGSWVRIHLNFLFADTQIEIARGRS